MIPTAAIDLESGSVPSTCESEGWRAEERFLLWSVSPITSRSRIRQLAAIARNEMDWDHLIRIASHHQVLPILHRNLQRFAIEGIPPTVQETLHQHFRSNALRNLYLVGELFRILALFQDLRIWAIPFKGPVLAASIYGDHSLREFVDLDILVRKRDLLAARDTLLRNGYVMDFPMTDSQQVARLASGCATSLSRSDGKAIVDLHWEFAASKFCLPFNLDNLRGRVEKVTIAGHEVTTLSALDALLLLAVHGAKHRWARLEWICDVGAFIATKPNLDWQECLAEAHRLRAERILLHALLVAKYCLAVDLPDVVEHKLRADPVARTLAARAVGNLFHTSESSLVTADETAFHLQMREQLCDRWPYLLHQIRHWMIPTERDRETFRLPAFLSFLYYPLRPVRLLFEYGLNPFSHFLKSFRLNKP